MNKEKIALICLGCSKNTVDSELILGMLSDAGYDVGLDFENSAIVIINTCSFIQSAEAESIRVIMDMVARRKKILIVGCLAQKYGSELLEHIPEASVVIGTSDIDRIVEAVDAMIQDSSARNVLVSPLVDYLQSPDSTRFHITIGPSAYIKIAEGCNWHCTYCLIPALKGSYRSRPVESIVKEAKELTSKGIKEIVLIAQDTTGYGIDLYGRLMLVELLKELDKISDLEWVRLLYAYPHNLNKDLLDYISSSDKVLHYIDMPLQHAHKDILKAMNRPDVDIERLLDSIRTRIPDMAIRTCFITGFPGETEEHFEFLYNFVKNQKFSRLGVFEYSKEEKTPAYRFKHHISAKVKKQRRNLLMELQQEISLQNQQAFVGKTLDVLVESIDDKAVATGRSYMDAPEIDGLVYVNSARGYLPGDIIPVKINKVTAYDFYGVVEN